MELGEQAPDVRWACQDSGVKEQICGGAIAAKERPAWNPVRNMAQEGPLAKCLHPRKCYGFQRTVLVSALMPLETTVWGALREKVEMSKVSLKDCWSGGQLACWEVIAFL